MTATTTHRTVAYVTDHGTDGVARVFVNVYRNGTRLAATEIPGSAHLDAQNVQTFAAQWLGDQGYTLISDFANAPFASGDVVGCDYKIILAG